MLKTSSVALLMVAILAGSFEAVRADCTPKSSRDIKTYVIDLDKPASERFIQPAIDYKEQISALIEAEKASMKLNPIIIKYAEAISASIDKYFPYPFNEELKGLAQATGNNLGDVVFANLIYDITAFCTSIVAKTATGQIIHGRNLDYGQADYLKNVTYRAQFVRNGTVLFTAAQLAGYIGILSGHKHNAFTFSIDERDQGAWWINFIQAIFDKKASPLSFLTRAVMENATSFTDAVNVFSAHDLIAPAYFILGGVKGDEGAVITRAQTHLLDVWRLNASSPGIEQWYLLETNYDHWLPPPSSDDRRTPGMKAMNATGQANINYSTLLNVLTINPVCNPTTVYSVVMSAVEDGDDGMNIYLH